MQYDLFGRNNQNYIEINNKLNNINIIGIKINKLNENNYIT